MTVDLNAFLNQWTYQFLLVFARVGGAIMLLPGIGDVRVPMRLRLLFALAVTTLVTPMVSTSLPAPPDSIGVTAWQVVQETGTGLFIGVTALILMSMLHVGGSIIAAQIGLSNALTGELFSADQGASIGTALGAAGLVIIFATGLDHLMLQGLVDSYASLPATQAPSMADLANSVATTVSAVFAVAVQLSTPFLVLGLAFNMALALANRALPQLPVFFVGLPGSLMGGVLVLMIAVPAILIGFAEAFDALFTSALP